MLGGGGVVIRGRGLLLLGLAVGCEVPGNVPRTRRLLVRAPACNFPKLVFVNLGPSSRRNQEGCK